MGGLGGSGGSMWVMGEWSVSQWILGVMRFPKIKWKNGQVRWVFGGFGGSVWVVSEWSVDQWIVGVLCFQKMYGLYGLKHHIVEMSPMRDRRTTREDRATQLLICEKLSLAILIL